MSQQGIRRQKIDTSFSTAEEINSFVNFNMKSPIQGRPENKIFMKHPDVKSTVFINGDISGHQYLAMSLSTLNNYINPLAYQGQSWEAIKDNYTNNKAAFIVEA